MQIRNIDITIVGDLRLIDIFTKRWFEKIDISSEKPIQTVNHPGLNLYIGKSFEVFATPNRIRISTKSESYIGDITKIFVKYVELAVVNSKFTALGFNFLWISDFALPIKISIENVDLHSLFNKKLSFGSIFYEETDDYRLRLVEERDLPKSGNGLSQHTFNFNYHHDIISKDAESIKNLLNTFKEKFENSKRITEYLTRKEGGNI